MPWTVEDVDEHKKGLSAHQKRQWCQIANDARRKCMSDGGSEKMCDARAVRMANGRMGEMMSATDLDTMKVQLADLEDRLVQLHARHNQKTHGRKGKGGGGKSGGGAGDVVKVRVRSQEVADLTNEASNRAHELAWDRINDNDFMETYGHQEGNLHIRRLVKASRTNPQIVKTMNRVSRNLSFTKGQFTTKYRSFTDGYSKTITHANINVQRTRVGQ